MSQTENGNQPPRDERYVELVSFLADPHRHQTARQWEQVAQSELGPDERAKAERMAPAVRRYLSKETTREEYERELGGAIVPDIENPS